MTQWVTKELAQYAVAVEFDDYPADTVDLAKMYILDSLGCMFGGAVSELGQSMIKTVGSMGGEPQSSVIGTDIKMPTVQAALINGTTANALDFDETLLGLGHPGATVISTALALGEKRNISGKDFISAVLLGYDIGNRIGRAVQPTYARLQQVWFTGTWQTFGSVSAAAKILGLDLDKTLNAYGIAGATAPLASTQKWGFEAEERPVHWVKEPTGWPSWTGLMAAELASNGFIGNRFILDGEHGFWIMAGSDQCNFEMMTEGLGSEYEVRRISIKPYSTCRWHHAALDCITELKAAHALTPEQIERVVIHSFDWVKTHEVYAPTNMVDTQFCIPHAASMVLHGRPPGPAWSTAEVLFDEDMIAFSRKISVEIDEKINKTYHAEDKIAARVEITTTTGETHSAFCDLPRGELDNPVSQAEVENKFRGLASDTLGADGAEALLELVGRLDELDHICELMVAAQPA